MHYRIVNLGEEPICLGPDYPPLQPGAEAIVPASLRQYRPIVCAIQTGDASFKVVTKLEQAAPPPLPMSLDAFEKLSAGEQCAYLEDAGYTGPVNNKDARKQAFVGLAHK